MLLLKNLIFMIMNFNVFKSLLFIYTIYAKYYYFNLNIIYYILLTIFYSNKIYQIEKKEIRDLIL